MLTCRICTSADIQPQFTLFNYNVMRCAQCTGEFLEPQPTDETLAQIYTADYFFARDHEADRQRHAYLKKATARKTLAFLSRPVVPGTTLLDIGCGTGDFLCEAASAGYDVTGVEFSETSAATASSRVPGRIIHGSIDSAAFDDASFDVVASSDVIEHVRDPLAFSREIRRILRPGGVLLLSTPDLGSWSHRLLGQRWVEYKVEHLFYLNRSSLTLLLRKVGFTSFSYSPNVKVLSAAYVTAHFERFPVPFWTPLTRWVLRLLPTPLRHAPFPIGASGITVMAR
jgi:2-polyprenyl-3-methyl-5-hydroxy-6-metoxy-1,4-benzoquinol methylase